MRKAIIGVAIALVLGVALVLASHPQWFLHPKPAPVAQAPTEQGTTATLPGAPPSNEITHNENLVAPPIPYFPPPTGGDLTGAKLGNQRVPGADAIGDVGQLYLHPPTLDLYMTVIEPDSTRSIWRYTARGVLERVFIADRKDGEIRIDGDSSGVMFVQVQGPDRMYRTDDGFKTWHVVRQDDGLFWQIAGDGKGTFYGTLHDYNRAILYRSQDGGFSWEQWKDFQQLFPQYAKTYAPGDDRFMLRHLHGVIYDSHTGSIIVGTGDVARFTYESRDDGQTWRQIWDEGFTASTPVSGGDRYLLCPDQLHRKGIALYNAWLPSLKEVWSPIPYNYAGYCYSMANVDGIYYAALHTEANEVDAITPKFGIIVSPDAVHWYSFLEWGPLEHHARTDIWLAAAPGKLYTSVNGTLYAFRPLERSWFEGRTPFQ